MLDTIIDRPFALARHREAPLLKERELFLRHLQEQGTSRKALRNLAGQLLNVIRILHLREMRDVSPDAIAKAAQRWARLQRCNPRARSYGNCATFFKYAAKKWLRFCGRLKSPIGAPIPFANELNDFVRYMNEEQGLSPHSVLSHRWKTSQFLEWFGERHRSLKRANIENVDEFLAMKGTTGWNRRSVSVVAQALRAFFRYAEMRGWCATGLAKGIEGPKVYRYEGLPDGPDRKQIFELLRSVKGTNPVALRARAILLLFTNYGLRSGEVSRLMLSDFDWRKETFLVNHSKRVGPRRYPLQRTVGDAIVQYLKAGRPQCTCRHLFVTLNPPYRPLSTSALWQLTSRRFQATGIHCRRRGPHTLRHACASRLLREGASFKEIADVLGHRSLESVGIYAKVDLPSLRNVAAVDLGGLA